MKTATKKEAKSPAKRAAETKAKKAAASAPAKQGKEIDVEKLGIEKTRKMLTSIHRLERHVERAKSALDVASKQRRAAKAKHEEASEALEREIREQRFGPGPLYNVDGSGAAGVPQKADKVEKAEKVEAAK